eukprot:s760_g10.t1
MEKNDKSLATLQAERDRLLQQRDTVCLRVLSIVSSLLRWSNSDLRKDPALMGALHQILLPMIALPALSKEVEVSVVYSICIFCVRDGEVVRSHWSLLLTLLRGLQEEPADPSQCKPGTEGRSFTNLRGLRARAAVAARALADCARIHGHLLDRVEVLSAASALSAVPFSSRQVSSWRSFVATLPPPEAWTRLLEAVVRCRSQHEDFATACLQLMAAGSLRNATTFPADFVSWSAEETNFK